MSRFQPHVSRDRDTSKGKSDFANVLTEGWANIFEPFVPVVCTVTSSEGGVCRGATSRPHFFPSFFSLSLSFFFFLLDGKTTENNAFEKRCARYALVCVNVGWKMCGVAGGKQEGWNCYSTWFPAKWRSSSLRDRMNWKIPFRKSITPRRQVDRLKKKKRKKMKQPLWKNLVKIDGIVRNEERDVSIMKRVKWIIWLLNVRNQENQGVIVKNWRRFEKWLKMK